MADATPAASARAERSSPTYALVAMLAAFATYFCMYAFRKPFAVGMYEGHQALGIDYKILLLITQVAGYTLSKFGGIRIISEMPPGRRIPAILALIAVAEVALVLFGLVPPPYNFVCLFFNGLPLGLIWGIVFSFVEGRHFTEMLGAALCTSFIVASGVVKSVGKYLMTDFGVSEFWMPAATGLVFTLPLLVAVWMLSRVPPPTAADEEARSRRPPMTPADRRRFFGSLAFGIIVLVAIYTALNTYRDFRDNFAVELWKELGYDEAPAIFTLSEIPIAVIVLIGAALMVLIRDNRKAFRVSLLSVFLGAGLVGGATLTFRSGVLHPALWMVAVGLGLYLPYIAYHVMVYERLIAVFRRPSNVGFLMYISDSFGYVGSVAVMLYKYFGHQKLAWVDFFVGMSYALAVGSIVLIVAAIVYFSVRLPSSEASRVRTPAP